MTGTLWKVFRAAAKTWLEKEQEAREVNNIFPFDEYEKHRAWWERDVAESNLISKWEVITPVIKYAARYCTAEVSEAVIWECLKRAIKPEIFDAVISNSEGDSRKAIFTATRLGAWREEAPTMPDIPIYAGEAPVLKEADAPSVTATESAATDADTAPEMAEAPATPEGAAPSADTPLTSHPDPAPPSTPAPSPARRSVLADTTLWKRAIEAFKSADWITETTAPDGSPRYQWKGKPTQLAYAMGELFGSNYTPWKDIEELFGRNPNTLRQNYDNVHKAVKPQPWRAEIDTILAGVKKKQ